MVIKTRTPQYLQYDVVAISGDNLNLSVSWRDATGAYVDFSGATGKGQIKLDKTDTESVEEFTVALGSTANNIQFSLTAAQVAALTVGNKYYYDIQITEGANIRTYIIGYLKTTQDVSRP